MKTKEELRNQIRLLSNALHAIEDLALEYKRDTDLFQRKMKELEKLIQEYAKRFL